MAFFKDELRNVKGFVFDALALIFLGLLIHASLENKLIFNVTISPLAEI